MSPLDGHADETTLLELAQQGLVVTDGANDVLVEFRRRDEQLAAPAWNATRRSITR